MSKSCLTKTQQQIMLVILMCFATGFFFFVQFVHILGSWPLAILTMGLVWVYGIYKAYFSKKGASQKTKTKR